MKLTKIITCGLMFILLSCVKEVDMEYLRPAPKLVLNCFAQAGQPLTASLSRTKFYTEDHPYIMIIDAEMKLFVNDRFVETMVWSKETSGYNNQGCYVAEYKPKERDNIRIEAASDGYNSISSEVVVPPGVAIESGFIEKVLDENSYPRNLVHVTFTDVPGRKDYYMIYPEWGYPLFDEDVFTGEYRFEPINTDYSEEPLFSGDISTFDQVMGGSGLNGRYGRVFPDDMIDGKTYTMKLNCGSPYYNPEEENAPPITYRITLYTISEGYYSYMKSVLKFTDDSFSGTLTDAGLAEPVRIYSNIEGGTGIFGCASGSVVTISDLK